ncbi:hypothetical protein HMPREF1548_02260 [Clostridium sp. KLE 1755]|nr:hypothetical protein HMPREF1548_02260 [Clostridium sp. KLE 1755]
MPSDPREQRTVLHRTVLTQHKAAYNFTSFTRRIRTGTADLLSDPSDSGLFKDTAFLLKMFPHTGIFDFFLSLRS